MEKKLQIYQTSEGEIKVNIDLKEETIWLNLNQIATLFGRDKSTISRHIKNIFRSGELNQEQAVAIFATTANDGKTYQVEYYNLDMIISIGYRVDSKQATQFRIWANKVLKDYILKGYVLNEKALIGENVFCSSLHGCKEEPRKIKTQTVAHSYYQEDFLSCCLPHFVGPQAHNIDVWQFL